jgi:polyisoprenoid-binding protein YceI
MSVIAKGLAAAALVTASLAPAAQAEPVPYTLDRSHTAVTFTVDHLGYSLTHGFFTKFDADILYDPEEPETSSVTFTIDAASINTLWEARDAHVRGSDFLNVEDHAEIVFKSKEIEMTGEDTARLTGDLTILDKTNEETFDVLLRKSAPSPLPAQKGRVISGFSITGEIDRTDYGVTHAVGAVGTVLPVTIELEIYPTP